MTAGAEVVCNEVVRKVEIEKDEFGGVVTVDCNVGGSGNGNGNCNVGGNEENDDGDSSHVFVSDSIELSAGDSGDTGGAMLVSVDEFLPKSDSADEIGQLKKKELGVEKEVMRVDPLVLETNGMVHGSTTVSDAEVKNVKKDVNLENGSAVIAIAHDANGHHDKISVEQDEDVKSTKEVNDVEEIKDVEAITGDIGFGLTFAPELTMNTIESSQVTVSELEAAIKPSDVTHEDMVNDRLESVSNLIGSKIAVDDSGKTSENLELEVAADGSDSSGSQIEDQENQATVDGSRKSSEDLGSQATINGSESCGSPIKEGEFEVLIDGSESTGSLVDNQECMVSVDVTEVSANYTEKIESCAVVKELDAKSEEHKELLAIITSEVNGEVEPNHLCSMIKPENKKSEETEIQSVIESEENLDSVEMELNTEKIKKQVKVEGEIQESQRLVINNVQDDLYLENNAEESANEAESSLETETNIEAVIHENTSLQNVGINCIDKPQEGFQPEASAEIVETAKIVESECNNSKMLIEKDNDSLSNPGDLKVVEQKVEIVSHLGTENRSAEGGICGIGIENVDVSDDDDEKVIVVKDAEEVNHIVTDMISVEGMDCGTAVENVVVSDDEEKEAEVKDAHAESEHQIVSDNRSAEDKDCETGVKSVDFNDEEKESEVNDVPVGDYSTLSFSDTVVNSGAVIEFGSIGRHETTLKQHEAVEDINGIQSDDIAISSADVDEDDTDEHNKEFALLKYNFLVKVPRFEDETFRDQIRNAQVSVDEKTRLRDSIRAEVIAKRANMRAYNDEYNVAKSDEIAARRLVKAKRQEIETVQAVIDRWKNAMSVEDIDTRIYSVEYMIQHETLLLKDEKQLIREIKQLKSLRDQLASHMGTPEEIRHAIDTKDQNEERLKALRKELDALKAEVSKVEAVLRKISKKYEEESKREIELQGQFRDADIVRQQAYAHLNSLKKQSYDKNKIYREFKDDVAKARIHATKKDKVALHSLCANQVETFMKQWNNDDEFRQDYVNRLNMIAIRRQKAFDAGPPVTDDVAPSNVNEEVVRSPVSVPDEVKHVSVVLPVENKVDNNYTSKTVENLSGEKDKDLRNNVVAKPMNNGSDDMAKEGAELAVVAEVAEKVVEKMATNEEIELARKTEELRKEEIAAKLKEQRRLEEKAKAIEALERKKRNAEKAQLKAEMWARKEAEQKEKEREKRLRKKEKKKIGGGDGDEAASLEDLNEATTKEMEAVNKKKTQKPPAHFFSKQLKPKPVPPPLINKNKKRWQQWLNIALCSLAILLVFLMINSGLMFDFRATRFNIRF